MKSVLISVGCDRYDTLPPLFGAEADATKVFNILTATGQRYSQDDSRLLLSPTREAFERVLLEVGLDSIEVLTIYFAGHGGTKEGGYYFCLRDSRADLLSLTAYPLNSLLNIVREVRPRFTYLIADSCNSGGSHHDIREILSDPRLGQNSASTFACLAGAAADQYAHEAHGAGLMTTELLKVFDGRLKVGSEQEEIDLLDAARVVSQQFEHADIQQRPVAWGLNLFGAGRLCRNPHFAKTESHFHVPDVPVGSGLSRKVAERSDALWELYRGALNGVDYPGAATLVREIATGAGTEPKDRAAFVFGLARAVAGRLQARGALWEAAEALGGFATFLLKDVRRDSDASAVAHSLLSQKFRMESDLIRETTVLLSRDSRYLLHRQSPMADYFYLSLRTLKLIASVAFATGAAPDFGIVVDVEASRSLIQKILCDYPLAFKTMSDDQAPALYIWSQYARSLGWQDEVEQIFGYQFSDMVDVRGRVGRCGLPPRQACEYLLSRGRNWKGLNVGWLANPGQLLAVLFLIASDNRLDEQVDEHLEALDHQRLNLFFPEDWTTAAERVMEVGVNRTHIVGTDIWRCEDFRALFGNDWARHASSATFPQGPVERALLACAAMIFPDRVPLGLRYNRTPSSPCRSNSAPSP